MNRYTSFTPRACVRTALLPAGAAPCPEDKIAEAHWFTGDELRDYAKTTGRLGGADSIGRVMLTAWLAEGATEGEPGMEAAS